jgi:hypothetical protein
MMNTPFIHSRESKKGIICRTGNNSTNHEMWINSSKEINK